jgi:hypothetical protein
LIVIEDQEEKPVKMGILNRVVCQHEWIEDYDPQAEADCYNDGFNYRPAEYICTKCKRKKPTHYKDDLKWYQLPIFISIFMILLPVLGVVVPLILLVGALIEELSQNKKT